MNMAAHGISDNAPNRQVIAFHDMKVRVTGILRLKNHALAPQAQALADRLVVEQWEPVGCLQEIRGDSLRSYSA